MMALVLNAGWGQFGVSAFTMHDQFLPPPVPLPGIPGLIEGPAFMGWPPGSHLGHKKARTVIVDGNPGVQQGHDVGPLIPHFAIPLNTLCLVHTGLSKHKVMVPVSSVLLEGKPVGTYGFWVLLGLICANPVSLPTGVLMATTGTVQTTATLGDILKGLAYIAIDIVVDLLWRKLMKGLRPAAGWLAIKTNNTGPIDWFWEHATNTGLPPILDKIVQGIVKATTFSPIVGGGARGNPGIGKGSTSWKPFGGDKW